MSDTPKLMVKAEKCEGRCQSVMHTVEPSVAEVVVWLQEQNVGEEREHRPGFDQLPFGYGLKAGRYLVIPLDGEPPKESGE